MSGHVFNTHPKANPEAVVQGPQYRFTLFNERLVRFEWAEDGQFEDRVSTFAINREFPTPKFRVIDGDELQIITDHLLVSYTRERFSPESLAFHFSGKSIKYGAPWRFGTPTQFNLGGTARTLDGVDGRCDMGQGILSRAGYAVIDDSKSMVFDSSSGFAAPRRPGDRFDCYLFCYGRDCKGAIKAFYSVSGKQPVIPRYVLGNWWSRYYAYHQDEYVALMDKFRAHDIPLSVAVLDMDWHYVSDDRVPHAGWTGYTWNENLFPDPAKFRRELDARYLQTTMNDHPHGGIHSHEDAYEEVARFLDHDTSNKDPILFDPTNPKFMQAYFGILHRRLEKDACNFWWIDWQQSPYSKFPGCDPLWLLNHFQYLDSARDGRIPLIFSRYGGPGSHRHPIGFSGDTVVTWDSLAFQPEFTATASNIGYGWWSHDIGGHIRGGRDDELLARWTQLGVFSPVLRLHSTSSRWMSKEPWLYGDECLRIMSIFLRFRHRLIPYLYNQNILGSAAGEPLVQPMYWSYPNNNEAYEVPNQYYLGRDLLVAPIVQPRDKRTGLAGVRAWLPPQGRFVDLFSGTVYDGGRGITFYRPIEQYPVLIPEGSIIHLDGASIPQNGCLNPEVLEILVVVGQDGETALFETAEDNIFNQASKPHRDLTQKRYSVKFSQQKGEIVAMSVQRRCNIRFLGIDSVPEDFKIVIDGKEGWARTSVSRFAHSGVPCLAVDIPQLAPDAEVVISLGRNPQLAVQDHTPRLEELVRRYQVEFGLKDQLWNAVEEGEGHPLKIISSLLSFGYDEALVGPLIELISADSRSPLNISTRD